MLVLVALISVFVAITAGSIKDQPNLPESKQKPILISGNPVITADPSIVIRSDQPNSSFPQTAQFRQAQGLDTLRGFVSNTQNTLVVLDVPKAALGRQCSFHFFFGSGDSLAPETFVLWKLDTPPLEFSTSWVNRPRREVQLAEIHTGIGPKLSLGFDSSDAVFNFTNTSVISRTFRCDPLLGRVGYELALMPSRKNSPTSAWSMNKGLMIEIHSSYPKNCTEPLQLNKTHVPTPTRVPYSNKTHWIPTTGSPHPSFSNQTHNCSDSSNHWIPHPSATPSLGAAVVPHLVGPLMVAIAVAGLFICSF